MAPAAGSSSCTEPGYSTQARCHWHHIRGGCLGLRRLHRGQSSTACLPQDSQTQGLLAFSAMLRGPDGALYAMWIAVYLLTIKNQALQSLQLFVGSTVIPFGGRIVRWHANKGCEYTGEEVRQYCLETGIIQEFTATNTTQQISMPGRVRRTLCVTVRFMLADSGFHLPCGGSYSWRRRTSRTGLDIRRSRWRRHSRCSTARKSTSRTFASSESEPSCTLKTPERSTPRPEKGGYAAIARRKILPRLEPKDSPRRVEQEGQHHRDTVAPASFAFKALSVARAGTAVVGFRRRHSGQRLHFIR